MLIKENIIILHRYPFSESSWILKAYGQENGLVTIMAKGAKRSKSSISGTLEPLSLCQAIYIYKENRQIQTLKEAFLISHHDNLRADLEKQAMASVISEIILKIGLSDSYSNEIYKLLLSYINLLNSNNLQIPRKQYVISRFIHDFCEISGFGLQLHNCLECGQKISTTNDKGLNPGDIRASEGGVVCCECNHNSSMSFKTISLIFNQANSVFIEMDKFSQNELEKFFYNYLNIHIGKELHLKSKDFLQTIREF